MDSSLFTHYAAWIAACLLITRHGYPSVYSLHGLDSRLFTHYLAWIAACLLITRHEYPPVYSLHGMDSRLFTYYTAWIATCLLILVDASLFTLDSRALSAWVWTYVLDSITLYTNVFDIVRSKTLISNANNKNSDSILFLSHYANECQNYITSMRNVGNMLACLQFCNIIIVGTHIQINACNYYITYLVLEIMSKKISSTANTTPQANSWNKWTIYFY